MQEPTIATESVARIEIPLGTGPQNRAELHRAFREITAAAHIKALVVIVRDASTEEASLLRGLLETLDLPTAAIVPRDASLPVSALCEACLFQFIDEDGSSVAVIDEAVSYLRTLTDKRPKHVISSVMRSLHNAVSLPIEDALLEETRLFCELSRRNRAQSEKEAP